MRRLLAIILLFGGAALLLTRAEPLAPTVVLETPVDVVGRATPLVVVARDRGTGLAHVEVRLASGTEGAPAVVAREDFPRRSWLGSGVHEVRLMPTVDAAAAHLVEGPARLEIVATDHSWLAALRRAPRLSRPVTIDLTPPTLEGLSRQHVVRLGGAECAVYRVGADAVTSGITVGETTFPGVAGLFADGALRAALFAVPPGTPAGTAAIAVAADQAGNRRTVWLDAVVHPRRFAEKSLELSDDFLSRKVPELLQANGLDGDGDLGRDRGDRRGHGQPRRHHRQDGRHRPRGRRPSPLQHHDPRRPRRPGRVVGRALDPRPRRVPSRGLPAGGSRPLTARHAPGTATLARLGLDAAELAAGRASDDEVLALLAGPDGVALDDALGELP